MSWITIRTINNYINSSLSRIKTLFPRLSKCIYPSWRFPVAFASWPDMIPWWIYWYVWTIIGFGGALFRHKFGSIVSTGILWAMGITKVGVIMFKLLQLRDILVWIIRIHWLLGLSRLSRLGGFSSVKLRGTKIKYLIYVRLTRVQ